MTVNKRNVLLLGGGFHNQGAYLMTLAAADFVRQRLGGLPVIEVQHGTPRQKAHLGLATLLSVQKLRFTPRAPWLRRRAPHLWDRSPFLTADEIDAVLDISGYMFGDAWAHTPIDRVARYHEAWARSVPVYLLPQAFGPFTQTAEIGRKVVESAAIVFARDRTSFAALEGILEPSQFDKVKLSTDFTIGVKGNVAGVDIDAHGSLVIIPNWNILKRASNEQSQLYYESLVTAIDTAGQVGLRPFGLLHEGKGDRDILFELRKMRPVLELIEGLDGVQAKGLMAEASVVVSGRFHGAVSALSCGTPTVLHGWSHKYREIAEDFGVPENLVDPYDPHAMGERILACLHDTSQRVSVERAKAGLEVVVGEMWDMLERDIKERWANSTRPV